MLCPDALPHALWVREGIDLFLVTSPAGAAGVRRYAPRARVAIVPPPVRPVFYQPTSSRTARAPLGIPPGARCVLLMGGGWGLGPVEGAARSLAAAGVHVLAVAGHNRRLEARLRALAASSPRVHPYGFTRDIAGLMSACDLVVTLPGALTCAEARAAGRRLMLVDAMPGHGRENVQHELEQGGAGVCNPRPADIMRSVLAALDQPQGAAPGPAGRRLGGGLRRRDGQYRCRPGTPAGGDGPRCRRDRRASARTFHQGGGLSMMRTLCLHPPSYEGFDGGAGSRYQAKREIRSFWYPTWLAQVAAIVPGSKLVDAPAAGLSLMMCSRSRTSTTSRCCIRVHRRSRGTSRWPRRSNGPTRR